MSAAPARSRPRAPYLLVFTLDARRSVYVVEDQRGRYTVEPGPRCGCAVGRQTRACAHIQAVTRLLKKQGKTLGRLVMCPECERHPQATLTCAVCARTGELPEAEARALREAKYRTGRMTLAERQEVWILFGGEKEPFPPKTRVWPRRNDDGSWQV